MKFKSFAIYAMLFAACATFVSCDDDSRTGVQGYSDCVICQGKGYCEKSEMFGLKTSYWDCFACKARTPQHVNGGYNPSFQGHAKGSCNNPSHKCPGFINDGNNYCVNCAEEGFNCHIINH